METINSYYLSEPAPRDPLGRRAGRHAAHPWLTLARRHTRRLAPAHRRRVDAKAGAPVSSTPLPPPRAARTPRSRGFFLAPFAGRARMGTPAPKRTPGAGLRSLLALVFVAAAIVTALVVGAPAAVTGKTVNANPGLSMVGSTLVTPGFLEPGPVRSIAP